MLMIHQKKFLAVRNFTFSTEKRKRKEEAEEEN